MQAVLGSRSVPCGRKVLACFNPLWSSRLSQRPNFVRKLPQSVRTSLELVLRISLGTKQSSLKPFPGPLCCASGRCWRMYSAARHGPRLSCRDFRSGSHCTERRTTPDRMPSARAALNDTSITRPLTSAIIDGCRDGAKRSRRKLVASKRSIALKTAKKKPRSRWSPGLPFGSVTLVRSARPLIHVLDSRDAHRSGAHQHTF